jgi:hypothetical protein
MLLGQILVQKKWISHQQLEDTLKQKEEHLLGQFLLKKGLLREEQLECALQEQYWRQNGYWVID